MTTGIVAPDQATFQELARTYRVVPVTRRLELADGETPGRRLPQARRRPGAPSSWSRPNRARASGGTAWSRYYVRRRTQPRHPHRAATGRRSGSATPPDGAAVDRQPGRGTTRDGAAARRAGSPGHRRRPATPLPVDWSGSSPTTSSAASVNGSPDSAVDDLRVPELGMQLATDLRRTRPLHRLGAPGGQRDPAGRARPRSTCSPRTITRSAGSTRDDQRTVPTHAATHGLHGGLPADRDGGVAYPRGVACQGRRSGQGGHPRRRVLPDRAALRSGPPTPTRWTSTGYCAPATRAPTCTCWAGMTGSTWSDPRRRRT